MKYHVPGPPSNEPYTRWEMLLEGKDCLVLWSLLDQAWLLHRAKDATMSAPKTWEFA